ncbi:UNVERIFIED_CONTAM: hypothetical protein HDU68_001695 [Siphonaria sp. JEL0065]|nr:hypothetical protein HDU68_001695 [Siphonaria sp. JEL0065]
MATASSPSSTTSNGTSNSSVTPSLTTTLSKKRKGVPTRSVHVEASLQTDERDELGIVKLDVFAVYVTNPLDLLGALYPQAQHRKLHQQDVPVATRASARQIREKALQDSRRRRNGTYSHPVSIPLAPMIDLPHPVPSNNVPSQPNSPVSSVADSDDEDVLLVAQQQLRKQPTIASTRFMPATSVHDFGPFTRDILPRNSKSKVLDYGDSSDIPGVTANRFCTKKHVTFVGGNVRGNGVNVPVVTELKSSFKMQLSTLVTILAAVAPFVAAQDLFIGSNCNLNIPNFNAANPSLPVTNGKADYINGQLVMTLLPPSNPSDPTAAGQSVKATSTLSLLYGSVEATVQQSTIGGAVTYLTLISDTSKDEIDYEWIGNERETVWTNFFYRGRRERDPKTLDEIWSKQVANSPDNSVNTHTYKIDWFPDAITWWIDGKIVRQQFSNETYELAGTGDGLPYDHYHYPNTPLTVNFGIWNYQGPTWANGPIDWTNKAFANGVTAKFSNLKVNCYNGPIPVFSDPITVPVASDILRNGFQTAAPPTTPPKTTFLPTGTAAAGTLTGLPTKGASSGMKPVVGLSALVAFAYLFI